MNKQYFKFIALKDAIDFIDSLPDKAREKVLYNIRKVREGVKDSELFKKLTDEIWEFRTSWQGNAYRLFAFWDTRTDTFVIATHGISKKSQKTPQADIRKAESIRKKYFSNQK